MAKYKTSRTSGTIYSGDFTMRYDSATQKQLEYAYEVLGLTKYIEKITNTEDESEKEENISKESKKKSKKSSRKGTRK